MKMAILVNGVPASGKSVLTRQLVDELTEKGLPVVPFTLDTVKEALFAQIGTGDREYNRILGRASYHAIFNSIADFPDNLIPIIDTWHGFQPKTVLTEHLNRAGVDRVIEVWCNISPDLAAERYRARSGDRHEGHLPASYADELFELAKIAEPVALGPVIKVSGDTPLKQDVIDCLILAVTE